jgi:hypothetical protein
MSNRDDEFDFDDDLFGDDEDESGDEGVFGFDDDEDMSDIDSLGDFDDVDDDLLIDEDEESPGPNRTFIVLALAMILIFLVGLGVLFFALTRDTGPSEFELTEDAIIAFNNTQQAFLELTQTQAPLDAIATETQVVLDAEATEVAAVLATQAAEEALAMTAAAEFDATQTAEFAATATPNELALLQTQQAENLTATADAEMMPPPPEETPDVRPPVTGADAAMTATAIAEILLAVPGDATPTQEAIGGPGDPVATAPPVALPDTGLFDDFSGGQLSILMLAVVGLVGVIFGARRLRAANNRR